MTEQTANPTAALEVDPMTQSAAAINTDFPLIQSSKVERLTISKGQIELSKNDNEMFTYRLVTTEDTQSTLGQKLRSGYGFNQRIMLTPTGERTKQNVAQDLANLIKAVEGPKATTSPAALIANPSMYDGKPVDAKVIIRKGKDGFGDSNEARFQIPKA